MVVAINCRHLTPTKLEGFGTYTFEIVSRWIQANPEVQFVLIFDRKPNIVLPKSANVKHIIIGPPTRHPWLYKMWFEISVPFVLKKYCADVFFSPDGYNSLRAKIPSVITIHDLNFEHNPKDLPRAIARYLRHHFPKFAKKASQILTVSQYSKEDIVRTYAVEEDKISVVYNGANSIYRPMLDEEKQAIRLEYTEGRPYFLFVGSLHPRKNVQRLINAYQSIVSPEADLVIVGGTMWKGHQITLGAQNKESIHLLGYLNRETLGRIMGSALALTYVPYFEGFGIPMVEAMSCGIPILAANATCLPEIAGEAAIYCNPFDENDIKNGLIRIMENSSLCRELSEKGLQRAKKYDWDQSAQKSWEILLTTVNI